MPAIEHVDGSSGAIGNTVYGAIKELTAVIAGATVSADVRQAWLSRLYDALEADDMGYLDNLGDHWGELCTCEFLAAKWADELIECVRLAFGDKTPGAYFKGTSACLSSLFSAGQYTKLLDLLACKSGELWDYRVWGVRALEAQGLIDEAILYANNASKYTTSAFSIATECERILIGAGRIQEAHVRYSLQAVDSNTYVGTYRAIAKKYSSIKTEVILQDLVTSAPGDEGKWFAAIKEAGLLDLALHVASNRPCEPKTLNRASRDFAETDPKFALGCAMAALKWLVQGYGYEVTNADVLSAYTQASKLAEQLGESEKVRSDISAMVAGLSSRNNFAAGSDQSKHYTGAVLDINNGFNLR